MNLKRINSNDNCFNKAMEIYNGSFPIFERRTMDDQIKALDDTNYHFEVIYDKEEIVGILLYWDMGRYKYIEHFAIDSKLRGKNYTHPSYRKGCKRHSLKIMTFNHNMPKEDYDTFNILLKRDIMKYSEFKDRLNN